MASDEARSRLKRADFAVSAAGNLDDAALTKLKNASAAIKNRWPKPKLLTPSTVATKNAVKHLYLLYSQLSADAAHPSLSALQRYLVKGQDADGTAFRGIDFLPIGRPSEMAETINYACLALMGACVAFNDIAGPTLAARQFHPLTEEFEALKSSTGIE